VSLPNAAASVFKRLASKKSNSLKPLKYDVVHYLMNPVRTYMSDRAKIKERSTGPNPQDVSVANRSKDTKRAANWRLTAEVIAQLVETAKNILARTGGMCKTTPMSYGRAASRSAAADGDTTKGAGTNGSAGRFKVNSDHSYSDIKESTGGSSCTSSASASSDCDGVVLPLCVLLRTAQPAPAIPPTPLRTALQEGASGRSRWSLTAHEYGQAVLRDDGAIMAIIEITRSSASARASQADVPKQTSKLQSTAAARAADAALAATKRHTKLYVLREERESREADMSAHAAEQQAAAALGTASRSVFLEKLRVLKELFLQRRDASILQLIASMLVTEELFFGGYGIGGGKFDDWGRGTRGRRREHGGWRQ